MHRASPKTNPGEESRRTFTVLLLLLCFAVVPWVGKTVYAQSEIAHLSKFKGEVTLTRNGSSISLDKEMPIFSGDQIATKEGSAEITFLDNSLLKIRSQSDIGVQETTKKRKILGIWTKEYLSRVITVNRGETYAEIKPNKNVKTEFETLAVVTAVRGTTLIVGVNEEGYAIIHSEEGTLESNTQDGWATFTTSSGETVGVYICPPPQNVVLLVCYTGTLEVTVGNATVTMGAGEQAAVYYDPATGVVSMNAVSGSVEVTSEGQTVTVQEGSGTTCPPNAPPADPSVPTIDPCYYVEAPPPPALVAPPPPPPPPPPPASPSS
ncbi:MAG: FecR domain-containing protein [Deltaproteobacteria bacterium]|nr:FecR domain-containing protein [Deltaproteobacteria bacterium]